MWVVPPPDQNVNLSPATPVLEFRAATLTRQYLAADLVKLRLRRDGKTLRSLDVEGSADDLPGLAGKLAAAIAEAVQHRD
jgi:hypothetical protein